MGAPLDTKPSDSALATQVGGDHYKKLKIQPVEYIHANNIPFMEGSAIKYLTRWRDKGGTADLLKAKHFIDLLLQLEGATSG
jgi:UDP-3-O-acyl-N-acetylglucosamine deacetylase